MLPSKVKNARKIPRYWPRNVGQSPIIELLTQESILVFEKEGGSLKQAVKLILGK